MRRSLLHRSTACLVAFSVALFSLEAAVADVHDGDGSRPAMTATDAGNPPVDPPGVGGSGHRGAPGDGGHPMHVCHCTHAHTVGSITAGAPVSAAPDRLAPPHRPSSPTLPSRAQVPLVPPPIV